jgi:hypothetical protein
MGILVQQIHEHINQLPSDLQAELFNYILLLEKNIVQKKEHVICNDRKKSFAVALEKAVELNPFSEIVDPVVWQCEQRQDRLLPNRD